MLRHPNYLFLTVTVLVLACVLEARADDKAYFVTYDHRTEEPGFLEIGYNPLFGFPDKAPAFFGGLLEIGYGVKPWWTTELYLDHQYTFGDRGALTGFRVENRFRPFLTEYPINPVFYIEYARLNEADRAFREVTGHSDLDELEDPISHLKEETEHELEMKLILSSDYKGWNFAENLITEKNLTRGPWKFGYSAGLSRPLQLAASPDPCRLCPENIMLGAELYGGLGDHRAFGWSETAHYLAPIVLWKFADNASFRVSPGIGLTDTSVPLLLRFGVLFEMPARGDRPLMHGVH
ncbi:MAG: hypothetical protein ACE15E_16705 [Acidobacteriota bacterium]